MHLHFVLSCSGNARALQNPNSHGTRCSRNEELHIYFACSSREKEDAQHANPTLVQYGLITPQAASKHAAAGVTIKPRLHASAATPMMTAVEQFANTLSVRQPSHENVVRRCVPPLTDPTAPWSVLKTISFLHPTIETSSAMYSGLKAF